MNLLIEARNARSYHRECLTTSNSLRDAYDRLSRESLWVSDPNKYRVLVDAISTSYHAYIAARNATIEAEQAYNLAVTALLDDEE
jgi:hypothetical protein